MDARGLRRVLLDLVGTARVPDLSALHPQDWLALATMAQLHRLGPLLHARHGDTAAVLEQVRSEWSDSYRAARLAAMALDADLRDCVVLLEAHGFAPVALKGAFLARHAYPDPALRPMRDLDLLLPGEQVLEAYRLLLASGYAQPDAAKIPLEEVARLEQHMPALVMPRGSVLELHARVSELAGRLEYATPDGNEAALIARAVTIDGLRYPEPTDMLAHLITHAVYGHRFDCGPLLLSDLRFLAERHEIDWPRFWGDARSGEWERGAALVIALVREYHGADAVPASESEPMPPDPATLDLARNLLLQDYQAKKFARFAATILTGGWRYILLRSTGRVSAVGEQATHIDRSAEGGRLRWAGRQLGELWHDLRDPAVREQVRQLARFRRWIER
jgi:hypothetical protein